MKTGWILDINFEANSIVVWIKDHDKVIKKYYPYNPSFYVSTRTLNLQKLERSLEKHPHIISIGQERKYVNIRDHHKSPVLKITVDKLYNLHWVLKDIEKIGNLKYYNIDIPHIRKWLYHNELYPTAKVKFEGRALPKIVDGDSRRSIYYELPEFNSIQLDVEVQKTSIRPRIDDKIKSITIKLERDKIFLDEAEGGDEAELLLQMSRTIKDLDPDIIYTTNGDAFLFPYLIARGSYHGILDKMSISRDHYPFKKSLRCLQSNGSYQSYGITYYRSPLQYFLHGRLHIDGAMGTRAFPWQGLDGIIEVARVSMVPIQKVARITIGQAMTSMQFYEAMKNDILVPKRKVNTAEKFKSGLEIVKSDKGGFIFTPKVGFYEDVYELDFTSMYPTIMLTRNVSPETILCSCKKTTHHVPELGYNICDKRMGLVPRVLKLILEKRIKYKKLGKKYGKKSKYYARQAALKWILVTSFGYMGYRNARFGRIEAHESVTAFARKILLDTLQIAEKHGFKVLHGIVDCLWVQAENNINQDDIKLFCDEVKEKTQIELDFEGKYDWIIFLPLKSEPSIATLNHYYGKFKNGGLKVRGLQIRRHNTPKIVKDAQEEVLEVFKKTHNWNEFNESIPTAKRVLNEYINKIKNGGLDSEDLLIKTRLSKDPADYAMNTRQVITAKHLQKFGIKINAGQMVHYVITNASADNPMFRVTPAQMISNNDKIRYDKKEYIKLLKEMFSDMLSFRKYGSIPCFA
ncbi:MAG: hypothetical protein GF329_17080 [Candidatus Lokiarchaeota archaeon]|nr:hypothetical protein [Candidatus Lokiarchaeota archaeon]